jgi:hypothetical protein
MIPLGTLIACVQDGCIITGVVIDYVPFPAPNKKNASKDYAVKWATDDGVMWYEDYRIAYYEDLFNQYVSSGKVNLKNDWEL